MKPMQNRDRIPVAAGVEPPPSRPFNIPVWIPAIFIAVLGLPVLAWTIFRAGGPHVEPVKNVPVAEAPLAKPEVISEKPAEAETAKPKVATPDPKQPAGSPLRIGKMDAVPVASPSTTGRDPLTLAATIDREIDRKLAASGIAPSPIADDAEFLRRVYLDLAGHIPTAEKTLAFLDSKDPGKRSKLIDELLLSKDYGTNFAYYWRDLLVKRDPDNKNLPSQNVFMTWMAQQFNENQPWDRTVHAMLTAKGNETQNGETFFILANQDMNKVAPNKVTGIAAALFLGLQLQCAECHKHPSVGQWTQQDFWGLAAFFARTRVMRDAAQKGKPQAGGAVIAEQAQAPPDARKKNQPNKPEAPIGQINIPDPTDPTRTTGVAKAKLFGQPGFAKLPASGEHRPVVADWLVSSENPYFVRAAVNRLWGYFFARGFINPLDDIRPDSVASHPDLLKTLAEEFAAANFDVKHLIRGICNSKAYQRTSRPLPENETDEAQFSHMTVKVLTARMLLDSLKVATGQSYDKGGERTPGKRPEVNGGSVGFFDARDYDEIPSEYTYGIPQILKLMNGSLSKACDEMARKLAKEPREKAVEQMYLTVLSRRPTDAEAAKISSFVSKQSDPVKGYSGALWALLNGAEFICNR
jgi:Protein of unknown function (DUF1549)/Protein of unknown function (DUF1553)